MFYSNLLPVSSFYSSGYKSQKPVKTPHSRFQTEGQSNDAPNSRYSARVVFARTVRFSSAMTTWFLAPYNIPSGATIWAGILGDRHSQSGSEYLET
jgi:hypothetical protein